MNLEGVDMGIKRMWQRMRGTLSERPYNILVVSDLHLGCEIKAGGREIRRPVLDRQLASFIDWHSDNRTEGRPWRLILNGDIVDFVAITLTPGPGETTPFAVSTEERQYGLAPEEAKCIWKLARVAERHEEVFDALGRFLLKGNSVHIVRGNHDAEFHWPAVQAELRRLLIARAGATRPSICRRIASAIEFHAWFYLEPGFFYAEHGNAHDRYSLQTGFFEPIAEAERGAEMALPLTSQVLRYFVNRYTKGEDFDDADTWGVVEYLKWVFRMGNPLQIAADYFMMVFRLTYPILRQSLRLSRKVARAAGRAMDKKLGEDDRLATVRQLLGRFVGASEGQVRSLLAVASRPAEQSLFDSAQLFYLDRMLLSLVCLGGAVQVLRLPVAWGFRLAAFAAVGIVFGALNAILSRQRETDAHPLLLQAARRVAEIFDVRYVVMGHSHRAASEPVGASARYFNTGSWTNERQSEGFPHVCVEGRLAELRRWKGPPALAPAAQPSTALPPAPADAPEAEAQPARVPGEQPAAAGLGPPLPV
jgi:UDP-2,3-diacylglucosamine pyrophosphatase LpxH